MSVIPNILADSGSFHRQPHAPAADCIGAQLKAPRIEERADDTAAPPIGAEIYGLIAELYPQCRSITGDGVRAALARLQNIVPMEVHEIPSGTAVFDWNVPQEWNIRDAYIKDAAGRRVIDFRASNLHIVSYSTPVRAEMTLAELRPRLFTLPEHPDWIPYRTSYYREDWGFCLSHNQLLSLREGRYEVCIDSTLDAGAGPQVKIDNFSFQPEPLIIALGAKVTWKNDDDIPHNVVSIDKKFSSPVLDTGDEFSHEFQIPGEYSYYCSMHPKMTGRVIVKAA